MEFNSRNGESRQDYVKWLFEGNKHYIRNLLLLYIGFFPAFAIVDYFSYSDPFVNIFNPRVLLAAPLLIAAFASSYVDRLVPYIRTIYATVLFALNFSIIILYASAEHNSPLLYSYYSILIITIATLGLSMSCIALINTYIGITATSFIAVSYFVHELHIRDTFLFARSTLYILIASGLFIAAGIIIERFSVKLYKAQKNIVHEKNEISGQKEALENLNATKDRFFRIISHDLRSPFTSLIGYFDLLLRNDKKNVTVKKEDIQKIYLHTRRTYNLLNNLLNWSKTQLNQYAFKPEQYSLNDIFSENELLYQEIANQKDITITHAFPPNAKAYCDKEMIVTIVRNLLFNAIKFTKPRGEIFLTGTKRSDNKIELAVIDNGVGISDNDIEMILNPNVHLTKEGTHQEKGAGIGLIICNDLLKKHDTKLQIESKKTWAVSFSLFYRLKYRFLAKK